MYRPFKTVYDDPIPDPEIPADTIHSEETPPPSAPPPKKEEAKFFTQDQLNKFLAEERRKEQEKSKKNRDSMIQELQNLRDTTQLTEQAKESLENRIEQLKNESLTRAELDRKERDAMIKTHQKEIEKVNKDVTYWKNLYTEEKVIRDLTDAAVSNKAISPGQVVRLVRDNTKLIQEFVDDKPTGRWITRIQFEQRDDKGQPITLDFTPTEGVKRMSEMEEHWNLFNSGAHGGVGSFTLNGNGNLLRDTTPPKDPEAYRKWRAANLTRNRK